MPFLSQLSRTWASQVSCRPIHPSPIHPRCPETNMTTSATENWQTIELSTMAFPAEILVEYVRVYQHKGQTNIGCDPPSFPTARIILICIAVCTHVFPFVRLTRSPRAHFRSEFNGVQPPCAQERTGEYPLPLAPGCHEMLMTC